jgi:hypothetical protein
LKRFLLPAGTETTHHKGGPVEDTGLFLIFEHFAPEQPVPRPSYCSTLLIVQLRRPLVSYVAASGREVWYVRVDYREVNGVILDAV